MAFEPSERELYVRSYTKLHVSWPSEVRGCDVYCPLVIGISSTNHIHRTNINLFFTITNCQIARSP